MKKRSDIICPMCGSVMTGFVRSSARHACRGCGEEFKGIATEPPSVGPLIRNVDSFLWGAFTVVVTGMIFLGLLHWAGVW